MLKKKIVQNFYAANIAATVSGLALCFIPICNTNSERVADKVLSMAVAAIFWLGIVISQIFLWMSNAKRKQYMNENNMDIKDGSLGIVSFAKNRYGLAADILFFLSAIAVIVMYAVRFGNEWVNIIAIVVMFLSFQYHCFWNGRIYCCIKEFTNEDKKIKQNDKKV